MALRGTFDYTLDAKNRLTMPPKYREQFKAGVVLAKGTAKCIAVWTPEAFDGYVTGALSGMNELDPKADDILRYFDANSHETDLDSAGRVMVPGFLAEHAGLGKDVTVIGTRRRLEVWDRQAWRDYNENLDITKVTASFGHTPS